MEEKLSKKVMTLKEIHLEYKKDFWELTKSAWAAIRKYQSMGNLNNRHLVLTVLESGKSKIRVSADSVLVQGPVPVLQTAAFLYNTAKTQGNMTAGIRQYSGNIMWITGLLERENRICEKAIGGRLDYCSERLFTPSWQNVFPAPLTLVLATWTVCQFLSWDLQKSAKFLSTFLHHEKYMP